MAPTARADAEDRLTMIDPETLALVRTVLTAEADNFNALVRLSGLDPARDFRSADLSGMDMRGADLRGFDFSFSRFRDVDVTGADIRGTRFTEADLSGTDLRTASRFGSPDKLLAFFSYTRLDDEAYGLTELRRQLQTRVQSVLGDRQFRIFQDIDGIKTGEDWQERLDGAVSDAALFIAVLTPAFLKSSACRDELTKYLRVESEHGRGKFVLPLYMMTTPLLEDVGYDSGDELAKILNVRQRFDWRDIRDLPPTDAKYKLRLQALAEEVAEIVDIARESNRSNNPPLTRPASPP